MANATSPLNTNSKDLDPLVLVTGTSTLKRAVAPIAAAGITPDIANQGVATDVDDAAFTVGTSPIVVAGALADETATDSVDEGDAGALRMTLNRRLITAGQFLDDSAFGVATDYVSPIAALADETATDSVDEGDIGVVRMTLDRRLHVEAGNVAHDAVDSGNPVKIGGKASSTTPASVASGDRVDAWFSLTGARFIATDNGAGDGPTLRNVAGSGGLIATLGDMTGAITPSTGGTLPAAAFGYSYDGAGWSMLRGNVAATLLASAVRAATTASADQTNYNGRTALIVFDITAVPGTDTVTLTIQGKDPISGTYYTILAGAAQVGTGTIIMQVGQAGLTAVPNLAANNLLPRTWRVNVVHSAASNFTYSVSACVGV